VSDPGRIAETGRAFGLVVDGIIVVVDVEQIRSQAENKYVGDTVLRQLAQADMLILNKSDLVTDLVRSDVRTWLRRQAPDTPVFETAQAQVPPAVLLGQPRRQEHHVAGQPFLQGHGHRTWSIRRDRSIPFKAIARLAERLGKRAFRAKGFVYLEDRPQHRQLFQQVGRRWSVTDLGPVAADAGQSHIVVIEPVGGHPREVFVRLTADVCQPDRENAPHHFQRG
jgi:G3E family GTPase